MVYSIGSSGGIDKGYPEKVFQQAIHTLIANTELVNQWLKTFEHADQIKIADFFSYRVRLLKRNQKYAFFEVVPITR